MPQASSTRYISTYLKDGYVSAILLIPPLLRESYLMTRKLGYIPNIKRPRSLNEKIAHRKLYDHLPVYVTLSDKLAVKSWVAEKLGPDYLSKTLQHAEKFDDLRIDDLPDTFVIKATHDSGSAIIVDEKRNADWRLIKSFFDARLGAVYGKTTYEKWYEPIKPRLIIEERVRDQLYPVPLDYKFFCFHGQVKLIQVDSGRFENHKRNLYTPEWTPIEGELLYPRGRPLPPPSGLSEMIDIAKTLSREFDFVRVDLYNLSCGRVLFGEMTFAPGAGREPFRPRRLDFLLGSHWRHWGAREQS